MAKKNNSINEKKIINEENKEGLSEKNFERMGRELDFQLKKLNLDEQQLVLREKLLQVEEIKRREMRNDERKTTIELIETLQNLMTSHVVDTDKTIIGSEPIFMPVYDEIERGLIKKKIFDILNDF